MATLAACGENNGKDTKSDEKNQTISSVMQASVSSSEKKEEESSNSHEQEISSASSQEEESSQKEENSFESDSSHKKEGSIESSENSKTSGSKKRAKPDSDGYYVVGNIRVKPSTPWIHPIITHNDYDTMKMSSLFNSTIGPIAITYIGNLAGDPIKNLDTDAKRKAYIKNYVDGLKLRQKGAYTIKGPEDLKGLAFYEIGEGGNHMIGKNKVFSLIAFLFHEDHVSIFMHQSESKPGDKDKKDFTDLIHSVQPSK